jgi:hypothetical protein
VTKKVVGDNVLRFRAPLVVAYYSVSPLPWEYCKALANTHGNSGMQFVLLCYLAKVGPT